MTKQPFTGVYPIVATPFDERENVDFPSLERLVDHLISAGSSGLVLMANASEGYALTEAEKEDIVHAVVAQVGHTVPIVVTVNDFSVRVALSRAQKAEAAGADAIMCMPPFFGQWKADQAGIIEFFTAMGAGLGLPLILQDHPLSGIELTAGFLSDLLAKVPSLRYIKTEVPNAPRKVRAILNAIGSERVSVFGGMSGVLFPAELEAGACGTMPSACYPDVFAAVHALFLASKMESAINLHRHFLPLFDFELYCGGRQVIKEVLYKRGWIAQPVIRSPRGAAWDEGAASYLQRLYGQYAADLNTYVSVENLQPPRCNG